MKIIIAEDRYDDRYLLETVLKGAGHQVTATENGRQLLEKVQAGSFDMIISDILMPEMDGYQVCKTLKQHPDLCRIPFAFLTATYLSDSDEKFAHRLGADAFFHKPLDIDKILNALKDFEQRIECGDCIPKSPMPEAEFKNEHMTKVLNALTKKSEELESLIQKQTRTEQALRDSEKRYRSISSLTSDYFYQLTIPEGGPPTVDWIGGAFTEITGYDPDMISTLGDWLEIILPEDHDLIMEKMQGLQKGVDVNIQYRIRTKDDEIRWLEDQNKPLVYRETGRVTGTIGAVKDITRSKKNADRMNRLATAVEAAAESIMITDVQGTIQYVNPAFEKISGYTPQEVIGKNPRILKSGKHDRSFYKTMWDTISGGEIWQGCIVNRKKDGTLNEIEATIAPIQSDSGITHFVAVRRDMTKERQLEKQLQQSQKLEAIGTLAGGIAHDFNNILSAILGFSELSLEKVPQDSPLAKNIREVLNGGHRARKLVKQILAFARQSDQEFKPVQVSSVVSEVIELLRASLPSTIEIRQNIQSDALVMGEASQLHQVVLNLCTNAGHAMEKSGGILDVSLTETELGRAFAAGNLTNRPGPHLNLTVTDNGTGMPPHVLNRIFDPFFTTKDKGEGTGMGLSVVHGIVESHDGFIRADSELGAGSIFKVYLPVLRWQHKKAADKPAPIPAGGSERILFVDDEPALCKMGKLMLEGLGYTVEVKHDPLEALAFFKSHSRDIDAVVSDMTMPKLTGDELARAMMEIRPDIPVILCSGFSSQISEKDAVRIGIRAFVAKPVLRREIAKTLRTIFDG